MAGIVQNGKKRLIFIVVPQVRTKMREKVKLGKKNLRMNKSKVYTLVFMHRYTYTHPRTFKHINTDTDIHINALFVIQVR